MTEETTRAAVTDLYSAYAGGDGERMAALIADDVDFIIYGPVQVFPFAGHHQGKGAVLEALGRIAEDYLLESYVPQVTVIDGDRAAVMSDSRSSSVRAVARCAFTSPMSCASAMDGSSNSASS